jgi:hypothetical protein
LDTVLVATGALFAVPGVETGALSVASVGMSALFILDAALVDSTVLVETGAMVEGVAATVGAEAEVEVVAGVVGRVAIPGAEVDAVAGVADVETSVIWPGC